MAIMYHVSHQSFPTSVILYVVNYNGANDLAICQRIATGIKSVQELPGHCYRFPAVRSTLERKSKSPSSSPQSTESPSPQVKASQPITAKTLDDMSIAFAGMAAGSAIKARNSRSLGYEHSAQVNRRLTSRRAAWYGWKVLHILSYHYNLYITSITQQCSAGAQRNHRWRRYRNNLPSIIPYRNNLWAVMMDPTPDTIVIRNYQCRPICSIFRFLRSFNCYMFMWMNDTTSIHVR